jgi:positive regulator of sigma E activity
MKETGRISEVRGLMVTVSCGEIASCFGCMNQECKSNKRMITAENLHHFDLSPGQFVEIETSTAGAFLQFLQAVIPPVLGFIAVYLIVQFVFPASGDGVRIAAGVVGLFLAGLGFYLYRKRFPLRNNPQVVKVLDE